METKFSIEDIQTAYKRFKSYVYYDNFNLHIRHKISDFESEDIDKKIEELCDKLNCFCDGNSTSVFNKLIKDSGYIILPKTFKLNEDKNKVGEEADAYLLTNKNISLFEVSKITILYDAPIELFIIATIWTTRINNYLNISSDNYGYVVPSIQNSRLLFEPYFNKYQEWRDKGINAAKQQIERGNNVLIITLDIKNYFHSVQVDFSALKKNIPVEDILTRKLTDIIESICKDHTTKIYGSTKKKPILPIGLPSSGIIANWILAEFDKDIKYSTAPVYYGRYVDDMFLVVANVEPDSENVAQWMCNRFFQDGKVLKRDKKKNVLMTKKKLPVRFTGQHFTIDKVLIKDAIRQANISNQDTVLDIGAGKGFLTVHLLKIANNVVAIENDTALVEHLRKLFSDARNVQVVGCDFRNFAVPKFPFKVVSNIPYGITSDIFKILMFESLGNFLGGSIVLQLEPTQKLFSRKLYNPYTVFYHTFFDLKLVYEVGPESFFPPPTVKSALLNIKRKQLFFDFKFKAKYLAFISCLLEKPDLSVKTALKSIFRKSQVRSISEKFGLNLNAQIVCLSPSQWVNCFLEMLEVVPEKFHPS